MTLTMAGTAQGIPSPLQIVVRLGRAGTVVVLRGDVGTDAEPALSEALSRVIGSRDGDVVVDLAEVGSMDSTGVRVLEDAHQLLVRRGRRLTIRSPSATAAELLGVFSIPGLIDTFEVGVGHSMPPVGGRAGTT